MNPLVKIAILLVVWAVMAAPASSFYDGIRMRNPFAVGFSGAFLIAGTLLTIVLVQL